MIALVNLRENVLTTRFIFHDNLGALPKQGKGSVRGWASEMQFRSSL